MEIRQQVQTTYWQAREPGAVAQVARFVQTGQLVVIPTDTVYGLGCAAFSQTAVQALYQVKQRPLDKAIPVLLADVDDLPRVVRFVPEVARPYIEQYWPGPLTIVLPARLELPAALSPDDTIAVRIPDHGVARAVIRAAGGAMAVTSANLSGQPAAETAVQALAYLGGLVTAVLDAGPSPKGQASTVIDCTGSTPILLRQGPLSVL